MNELLVLVAVAAAALMAKTTGFKLFGLFYAATHAAHYFIFDGDQLSYAFSAQSVDGLCLLLLFYLSIKSRTIWQYLPLSIIMFLSIAHGFFGATAIKAGADVETINNLGLCVYLAVIAGLLWGHRVGEFSGLGSHNNLRGRAPLRRLHLFSEDGK